MLKDVGPATARMQWYIAMDAEFPFVRSAGFSIYGVMGAATSTQKYFAVNVSTTLK